MPAQPEADEARPRGADRLRGAGLCTNKFEPWTWSDPDSGAQVSSEELITENLDLARKYAWEWSRRSGLEYAELEAIAFVGLVKGCRKYDPAKGFKLSTIAVPWISGEILHFFRDRGYAVKYPSKWREVLPRARKLLEEEVAPSQVAATLGLEMAELYEMLNSMTGTSELKEEIVGQEDQPALDHEEERIALSAVSALREKAWDRMAWHDRAMIEHWWQENKRRAAFPRLQVASFARIVRHLLEGRPLPEVREQLSLQFEGKLQQRHTPKPSNARRPRGRSRKQLDSVVLQMGLFPSSMSEKAAA